jgi:hypothetical protein
MLRSLGLAASRLLAPEPAAIADLRAAVTADAAWRDRAVELLAGGWRDQVTAAAAIAVAAALAENADAGLAENADAGLAENADTTIREPLWRAIDGASWVAPQLVAAAFIADAEFEARAADRLTDATRRPPKTVGALVRAYHRCPTKRMPVVAQLGRHDHTMINEEARIGVRGVDAWLDYFATISRSS